ncbi:protein Shroom3 [Chanos chanos]|uniref:Protein Shroom3 n=1 Tax=Chanos chanos TaxID=29144 RepID=A0A6J2UVN7_CHACN|nr:protein Shroom3 [Chanos chanos]
MMQISQGSMGAWHQNYHSSASTTDLSSYEAGYLRKSPDQYSSRGSMESLDPPHPTYSSCHQLSSSKSSNSIDHLHSKRDSAYSSFSTSSSIPEYLTAAPSFSKERSYSMENFPQQRGAEGMQQADIRYVRTIYDPQQGVSEEHEVTSTGLMRTNESRAQVRGGSGQGRGNSSCSGSSGSSSGGTSVSHRHSVGPVWVQAQNRNSFESLKGAPAPPLRSDSYAAIRNHERPNSWSSLEQARSLRALHKGSWHHSSGSVASGKSSFGLEAQLHTVIEKSPESSPTTKPKQSFPQASQPGRPMLPTGIYAVPPPEPHFAQIPTSSHSSSGVYPALAKESRHTSQRDQDTGSVSGDTVVVENGYQSSSIQPHGSAQPKQTERGQEEAQTKCGLYRTHLQAQDHMPSVASINQERRDPYTPVQQRGERLNYPSNTEITDSHKFTKEEEQSRYAEQSSYSGPTYMAGKVAQGQVPHSYTASSVQAHGSDSRSSASVRQHTDTRAYQERDPDHPLTRLENALAEVQRCGSPESTASQYSFQSERSMSVLEKVSHFERREQTKPRSHSCLSNYGSSARASQASRSAKSSVSGVEDLRNMLERSSNLSQQGRTRSYSSALSHEGNNDGLQECLSHTSAEHPQARYSQNPTTILPRSKSTFQLTEENGQDSHWKDNVQDTIGTIQDVSFNRAYRDSIKDAQNKVLRSTSFRRRDLSINPPPVPAKHTSMKAPKTSPKPSTPSPHTPKERHVVPVEIADRTSPPELPSVPAVGPPIMRIGGRKRLTKEQKKRSYSEPENMHEVGVSDPETRRGPQQFLFPETSVADRRKVFEQVASRSGGPKPATSRPNLKQLQQDALAEYMERKTGRRVDGRPHRPHSAYLQSYSSSNESRSLSSTPSMTSLQDLGSDVISGITCHSSTFLAGLQNCPYPSKGPSNQAQPESYTPAYRSQGRTPEPQRTEKEPEKLNTTLSIVPNQEQLHCHSFSQRRDMSFERATPARNSGKSASAEDLLDRTEERPVPQHFRSRSSPAVEHFNQDFLARDLRLSKDPFSASQYNSRPSNHLGSASLHSDQYLFNPGLYQSNVPVVRRERQKHSERQRAQSASGLAASVGLPCPFTTPSTGATPDWQASERLCQANLDAISFPIMPQGEAPVNPEKTSTQMVRQSSNDTSTSEETLKDLPREGPCPQVMVTPKTLSPSPSPWDAKDTSALSLTDCNPRPGHQGPPTKPRGQMSHFKPLSFPRISESSLKITPPPNIAQDDDEVFLAPPSPPPPPLPIRETDITEDLPLPPPPPSVLLEEEESEPTEAPDPSGLPSSISNDLSDTTSIKETHANPTISTSLPVTPDPQTSSEIASVGVEPYPQSPNNDEEEVTESHGPEYRLLSKRERSSVELRVETLARDLVAQDKSLILLLDAWAGRNALDLMGEIFPASGQSQQQRTQSNQEDNRSQVTVSGDQLQTAARGMETDLDNEENDLNQKKMELLQALSMSLAVLHEERRVLAEEQKRFNDLGKSMEALVQECCKPNEREKYRMFIGDLDKIVNLLLSLSGRRARIESALTALDMDETEESAEERESLQQKRELLCSQQEDARELKENLDRRQRVVLDILGGYLSRPQLRDYQHFVRMKPALLIRQRHLDELIKQGEEQLQRLGGDCPLEHHPQTSGHTPCSKPAPSSRSTAVTSL